MDNLRRFKKVKIGLMRSKQFVALSGVMMLGKTTLTEDVATAMTNGRDEWYNTEFMFKFGDKGAAFIIVHENMHKAARHLTVYDKLHAINPQIANAACDYWINLRIIAADPQGERVEMPRDENGKPMGLLDEKYKGRTVLQIFNDLMQQKKDKQDSGGSGDGEGGDGEGSQGLDQHDWAGAKKMTPAEAKTLEQDVKQAVRQGQMAAKKAGVGAGTDSLGLSELLQSKVDWRAQLREFVNSTCARKQESSWRRPNRRFLQHDMIMPTFAGESIEEVVFARDASGSMFFSTRLPRVTGEMVAIAKAMQIERIHLLDWDGAVVSRGVFDSEKFANAPEVSRVHGGGGTDPTCVERYLKDKKIKPSAVIMLTDGEVGSWGNWDCPVLWVIANESKITAPTGKTIHIQE